MAAAKPIKPMPFPGESPTVSLAVAAGEKFGFHPEEEKPARARPKRSGTAKKKSTRPARKTASRGKRKARAR
jgi:hypothetical protein